MTLLQVRRNQPQALIKEPQMGKVSNKAMLTKGMKFYLLVLFDYDIITIVTIFDMSYPQLKKKSKIK